MMARLPVLVRHDARLQFRYGIYAAYAVVVAFYVAVLIWIGPFLPDWVPGVIVFSDPAVLGFFFLGALMMLEKAEDVRAGLAITPVSPAEYFWAKAIPLTGLAVVAVILIGMFVHTTLDWPVLIVVTVLASLHYLGFGVPAALHFRTVSSYLIGSAGLFIPVIVPGFLALIDDMPFVAILIPAVSQLRLILVATGARSDGPVEIAAMLMVAAIAAAATCWWAIHRLHGEMGNK